MKDLTIIDVIKEFQYEGRKYGVYSVHFEGKKEVFIMNDQSVGVVSFWLGSSASKCIDEIREDVKQKFFEVLENFWSSGNDGHE